MAESEFASMLFYHFHFLKKKLFTQSVHNVLSYLSTCLPSWETTQSSGPLCWCTTTTLKFPRWNCILKGIETLKKIATSNLDEFKTPSHLLDVGPTLYLPMEELHSKPFFLLKVAKFPSSPCLVKLNSTLEDCGGKFKSFPSTQYAEWCQYCIGTNLSAWFNTKHVEAEQLQFKMRNSEMTGIRSLSRMLLIGKRLFQATFPQDLDFKSFDQNM